jgi:hypothetical protein
MRAFLRNRLATSFPVRFSRVLLSTVCLAVGTLSAQAQDLSGGIRSKIGAPGPGALIASQPIEGAPPAAQAFRVRYGSTGVRGEPITVSGVIIVPQGPAPPGGRPIVAWAHPTTGVVSQCAPSLARVLFRSIRSLVTRCSMHASIQARSPDRSGAAMPGRGQGERSWQQGAPA